MKNQNEPAFATSSMDGYNNYNQVGLTKLEYFSIHCLQGMLSNNFNITIGDSVKKSIVAAKELLKQLENEKIN